MSGWRGRIAGRVLGLQYGIPMCGAGGPAPSANACSMLNLMGGAGGGAGRVCYWDLVEENLVDSFPAHTGVVCSLAVHPSEPCLLTAGADGLVNVWN